MSIFNFKDMLYRPEKVTFPVARKNGDKSPITVSPKFRHALTPEQYETMLLDKSDTRPIKKFF